MKGRSKSVVFEFSSASETSCKEHPTSSFVGICPLCLKERLLKLLVEERRRSSCSSSDVSSSCRNSCSALESGNIDRRREEKSKQVALLTRSNSSCIKAGEHEHRSLWRLFGKKNEKHELLDMKRENLISDQKGISSCRSVSSFGGYDESEGVIFSAKISDATNDIDAVLDESDFIDLELDLSTDSKMKSSTSDHGVKFGKAESLLTNISDLNSACIVNVNDKDLKRNRRGKNVLKRIFKHHFASKEANSSSSNEYSYLKKCTR